MINEKRKLLQEALTNRGWEAVEQYLEEYIDEQINLESSIRRDTDFNTVWDRAFTEGGKHYLLNFFNSLEEEARKYDK